MKRLIVFVCVGNMERSPVAEYVTKKIINDLGLSNKFQVISRGIQGTAGTKPTRFRNPKDYTEIWQAMLPALQKFNINLQKHISTPITPEIIEKAAVVIAMAKNVLQQKPNGLKIQFPLYRDKFQLFMELAGKDEDVPDGGDQNSERVHMHITETISKVLTTNINTLIAWSTTKNT